MLELVEASLDDVAIAVADALRLAEVDRATRLLPPMRELGNQAGIAIGTGLAGALVATMGATAAGLSGVLVVAGAGVVLALLAPTRFAETHPPLTPPER